MLEEVARKERELRDAEQRREKLLEKAKRKSKLDYLHKHNNLNQNHGIYDYGQKMENNRICFPRT